jgi:hypothetical protein
MKYLRLAVIAGVIFLPGISHAESSCPWINKTTAFGVLGTNDDSPMAKVSPVSATACSFTYRAGEITRELRVTVEQAKDPQQSLKAYEARCGRSGTPLQAIGNEAILCATDKKGQQEQVFGRVRDSVFTITLSTSAASDSFMSKDALVEKAKLVAEQVSGNLF